MKYGESIFDILYLVFALAAGWLMVRKAGNKAGRLMGAAALVLGAGDAFHLIPRVLNYFMDADLSAALGFGKLVTSVTMTFFYMLMAVIWSLVFDIPLGKKVRCALWGLTALRIILCLFPQNGWLRNSTDMKWGILRNIPFVILGAVVCGLYFHKREENRRFKPVWLYILFSFLFYIPVAVCAGILPMLGMLMLPKTVCYILLLAAFLFYVFRDGTGTAGSIRE